MPAILLSAPGQIPTTVVTAGQSKVVTMAVEGVAADSHVFVASGGPYQQWSMALPGRLHDIAIKADKAFLAADQSGLFVVDLASEATAELIARYSVSDRVTVVKSIDQTVYLGGDGGIYRIDISDIDSPRTQAYLKTDYPVIDLIVEGQTVIALLANNSVQFIEASQAGRLRAIFDQPLPESSQAMAVLDNELVIAAAEQGVIVYHMTAQGLEKKAQYRTTGLAYDLAVENGIAYVATGANGLTLLTLAVDGSLQWLGSHQQLGDVRQLKISRDAVLVRNQSGQLIKVDVSNPALPSVLSFYKHSTESVAFQLKEEQVFLVSQQALQKIDFRGEQPVLSNEGLDSGQSVNYGGQRRAFIRDDIAYVADWFVGVHLYDISAPQRPRLLSSFHTDGSPKGIVVRGDYAYVADDDHGLQILNIKDPRQPFRVSELRTAGLAYIPVLDGDRLYLAGHRGGFQIIDISDVYQPRLLGQQQTTGKTWAIRVKESYAYIADDDAGLVIYNIEDPENIRRLGQFNPGGDAEDVILDGDLAYVAFFENGVFVVDVSDPALPQSLAHIATPGNARGLAIQGDTLYVADWLAGIQVIDIGQPPKAVLRASYDTVGAAWGLAVKDQHAYVMDWWGGVTVLDISRPEQPQLVARYNERDLVEDIKARGKVLYAANGSSGLQIFDIKNPLNPTWMTAVELEGRATVVGLAPMYAYVAMDKKRLAIIDIQNPYQAQLLTIQGLPLQVDRMIATDERLIVGQYEKGLFVYSLAQPLRPKKVARIKTAWRDFVFKNNRLYIVDSAGSVQIFEENEKGQLIGAATLAGDFQRLVVWSDEQLLLSSATGLTLIDIETMKPLAWLPLANISALAVTSSIAHIATADDIVIHVLVTAANEFKIVAQQELRTPVESLTAHDSVLYSTGQRSILAISALQGLKISAAEGPALNVAVPMSYPLGHYSLVVQSQNNARQLYANVFSVQMPHFSKPNITLEEIQRRMEAFKVKAVK